MSMNITTGCRVIKYSPRAPLFKLPSSERTAAAACQRDTAKNSVSLGSVVSRRRGLRRRLLGVEFRLPGFGRVDRSCP